MSLAGETLTEQHRIRACCDYKLLDGLWTAILGQSAEKSQVGTSFKRCIARGLMNCGCLSIAATTSTPGVPTSDQQCLMAASLGVSSAYVKLRAASSSFARA